MLDTPRNVSTVSSSRCTGPWSVDACRVATTQTGTSTVQAFLCTRLVEQAAVGHSWGCVVLRSGCSALQLQPTHNM
jgi:hypothetical protein